MMTPFSILFLTDREKGDMGMRRQGGRGRNRRTRKLAGMALFAAAFFLSAAVAGKGCYLLAAKCIGVFAHGGDGGSPEEALQTADSGEPGDLFLMSDEAKPSGRIAIDAGHGGEDDGCYREGVSEAKVNLELAKSLSEKLQELGYETVMLREDDDSLPSLEERVEKARESGADIFVSIHQNAYDGAEPGVSGIETWYCGNLADSGRLAALIHQKAVERTGAVDRGTQETDELYVVRYAPMPSCLIETAFLSDSAERQAITSEAYQDKLVEGMAQGIAAYFGAK